MACALAFVGSLEGSLNCPDLLPDVPLCLSLLLCIMFSAQED